MTITGAGSETPAPQKPVLSEGGAGRTGGGEAAEARPPEEVATPAAPQDAEPERRPAAAGTEPPPPPAAKPERTRREFTSVLALFREYRGPRTPDRLLALFRGNATPGVRQVPDIALSDGVTTVQLTLDASGPLAATPRLSITGGKLVTLERDDHAYHLTILPARNTIETTVTALSEEETLVVPLTVAPPIDDRLPFAGMRDEAAYGRYLQATGTAKANGNGVSVREYRDDYVYAANLLVRLRKSPPPAPSASAGRTKP